MPHRDAVRGAGLAPRGVGSSGLPVKLAYCGSDEQRLEWIRAALVRGGTVTEIGLWLGGVDEPKDAIRALILEGLRIATFRKNVKDAAGRDCTVMAWRLKEDTAHAV